MIKLFIRLLPDILCIGSAIAYLKYHDLRIFALIWLFLILGYWLFDRFKGGLKCKIKKIMLIIG